MEIQEVDHRAEDEAVDDVADGAADDQRQGQRLQELVLVPRQQAQQPAADHRGQRNKEPALPAGLIGQQAEGGAGVEGQNQIKKLVTGITSPLRRAPRTRCLVHWSARTTMADEADPVTKAKFQRRLLGWSGALAGFAGAVQVGGATAAQLGVLGIVAHVGPVVPAAVALLVGRRGHDDGFSAGIGDFDQGGGGADQHEAQVIAQAGQ